MFLHKSQCQLVPSLWVSLLMQTTQFFFGLFKTKCKHVIYVHKGLCVHIYHHECDREIILKGNKVLVPKGTGNQEHYIYILSVRIKCDSDWFYRIKLVSCSAVFVAFLRCVKILKCRKHRGAEHQTRSLSHLFLIRPSRRTGNLRNWVVCVCVCTSMMKRLS